MLKYDLAQYLVNLHTLMDAQGAIGVSKSTVLADEYNRVWSQLKEEIENDETRHSEQPIGRSEEGTDLSRGEPSRRI